MNKHLLLVHAHPDDESIGQGATKARYVAEGVGVTLVTCTGGEMGEILVPEMAHMAADQDDTLADQRKIELDNPMKGLGFPAHATSVASRSTATPACSGTRRFMRSRPT